MGTSVQTNFIQKCITLDISDAALVIPSLMFHCNPQHLSSLIASQCHWLLAQHQQLYTQFANMTYWIPRQQTCLNPVAHSCCNYTDHGHKYLQKKELGNGRYRIVFKTTFAASQPHAHMSLLTCNNGCLQFNQLCSMSQPKVLEEWLMDKIWYFGKLTYLERLSDHRMIILQECTTGFVLLFIDCCSEFFS